MILQTPLAVANALLEAENAHDIESVVDLFATDAVVELSMERLTTRDQIRAWQSELARGNLIVKADQLQANGEVVTWKGTISVDFFRRLGLDAANGEWEITVREGKISSFVFKLAPDSVAHLKAATPMQS